MYVEMEQFLYKTSLSEEDFFQQLHRDVTLQEEFRLISYLSDGGVVVRGISPPDNCQTSFFGVVNKNSFRIVEHTHKEFISPYQPILHGHFENETIHIVPQMHPQAYPLVSMYTCLGALLVFLGILTIQEDFFIFLLTTLFGFLLMFFPRFRTQNHFKIGVHRAISAFENLSLQIQRLQDP